MNYSSFKFWYYFAGLESAGLSTHFWVCVEDIDNGTWSSGEEVQVLHKRVGLSYSGTSTNPCPLVCVQFVKFWFITYSLNMLYFCRSSGYRTPATFFNTSSSHPCVTEKDFCGGQRCHSSSTMLSSGICQTGCYASLGGFSLRLQSVCPPFQPCTSKKPTRCIFHYSHMA
jgi:hypothetical protein